MERPKARFYQNNCTDIEVESFFVSRYWALCLSPNPCRVTGAFSLERFAEGVERLSDFLHNGERNRVLLAVREIEREREREVEREGLLAKKFSLPICTRRSNGAIQRQ